jgi:hypothetical protein
MYSVKNLCSLQLSLYPLYLGPTATFKLTNFPRCRHPNFCRTDFCIMTSEQVGWGIGGEKQLTRTPPDWREVWIGLPALLSSPTPWVWWRCRVQGWWQTFTPLYRRRGLHTRKVSGELKKGQKQLDEGQQWTPGSSAATSRKVSSNENSLWEPPPLRLTPIGGLGVMRVIYNSQTARIH